MRVGVDMAGVPLTQSLSPVFVGEGEERSVRARGEGQATVPALLVVHGRRGGRPYVSGLSVAFQSV